MRSPCEVISARVTTICPAAEDTGLSQSPEPLLSGWWPAAVRFFVDHVEQHLGRAKVADSWGSVLAELVPLALVVALSPLSVIPAVLVLHTPRPRPAGFGFLAGWMVRRAALTVAFVWLSDLLGGDLDKPPPVGIVAAHHARSGSHRGRGLALAHSPPFGAFAGLAADDPHHHAGADAERFQALHQRAEQIREQERQRTTARRDLLEALASGRAMTEGEGSGVQPYTRDEDRPPAVQHATTPCACWSAV
jgi:hypothetical protein